MPGKILPFNETLGETIPPDTPHAVSVSLPTWESNVGYEKGESWVVDKMPCGYPRFFIHPSIQKLAGGMISKHGSLDTDKALLLPTHRTATRFADFLLEQNPGTDQTSIRTLDFIPHPDKLPADASQKVQPKVSAVLYPADLWPTAKMYWQHTGEGISSRRAEFCQKAFDDGSMVERSTLRHSPPRMTKGPRRYQRPVSIDNTPTTSLEQRQSATPDPTTDGAAVLDSAQFVEERFGRNLNLSLAAEAKLAIRRRIAGSLATPSSSSSTPASSSAPSSSDPPRAHVPNFSADDVYLFPCGMNAIFTSHRIMRAARSPHLKSIMYGFPYVDTLKILQKWGPGALFYGLSSASEIDDLERRLEAGERYLALFCEFPGNPLLRSPDLHRLRSLADRYDFGIVVDETIGNFLNIHVLPLADVVVSSLTKIFSGDSNVMGGSLILNPSGRYYEGLKRVLEDEYEDAMFAEDALYLERNSRDVAQRTPRINFNALTVAELLSKPEYGRFIKSVNYPSLCSDTKGFYDACRTPQGGYGGLLSCTFKSVEDAEVFYDNLDCQKGPSLGTNFTLASPFVILAHFNELDWAAGFGCEAGLVRFSVGLEETEALESVFERALKAVVEGDKGRMEDGADGVKGKENGVAA